MKPIDSLDDGPAVAGPSRVRSTTILTVCRNGKVVMAGDGQVTVGDTIMKHQARKVRKMYHDKILAGFSGATADAFTLSERFETKLETYSGNLLRAAVELAKDWRTDQILRKLEALLIVADTNTTLVLSGAGDVIEPDDGIAAIGSGGSYALAAARALTRHADMPAENIAKEALRIAGEICIYTNDHISSESLP